MADRTVTVAEAQVKWGYHSAAVLRNCTVTRTDGVWSLTGTVVKSDAFRLSQRPLAFEVTLQHGIWRWPVNTLQMDGASLTAGLGQKEP